ncbi:unnamed protein product [Adineta ricciae]|uniref:non-specific serine/threonine protein kinase n=1 Tax=Adineta ricciae TaxID=249248 RepID=A0A814J0G1_ADIRI|nr:unnamed protein product [Adineta ricciae]
MFSESPLSTAPLPIPSELSILSSPTSSVSASPLSSIATSRRSTITSTNNQRSGLFSSCQSNRQMKIGKYFLERTIGKGNFAVVKLATHCDTHQKVAIKIIDKSRLESTDHQKLEREIAVMKSLVHPYIIRLYEVMESKNLIYLVTEYAANGELLGDLKAENLLLDSHGNIKVADFGFANTFKPNAKLQTFCGSPPYAAPELFQCLPYSPEKVDVWALGVLLYIFVCGHLPFDSNNLAELRKRVLVGQFRLPFYISQDCNSLISHMLTVDPAQRYSINDIKNHPWLSLNHSDISHLTSPTQSIPDNQLTNAILDHAESLGYNRTQILKSVSGNSYDSDAAIWHLLLEKFQQTCQINNPPIPTTIETDKSSLNYCPPNTNGSIRSCDVDEHIDDLETYSDDEDQDEQVRNQYVQLHGLRRHTIGRPALPLYNNKVPPTLTPDLRFVHQLNSVEPALLTNRLYELQQQYNAPPTSDNDDADHYYSQLQYPLYHQRNPHSTSYNGLSVQPPMTAVSDIHNQPQKPNQWLSPPVSHTFNINRRASDSGAHLLLFQQQHDVTGSNPISAIRPTQLQSPVSNVRCDIEEKRSSRGSITRGAPITPPIFSITPDETEENDEEDDDERLARYLNLGKRHTVCEQGLILGGKVRRSPREAVKDRSPLSRRASDTTSNLINSTTKVYLERLYHNAVGSKLSDDDDVTTSSLQELHKLQKQVQKYPMSNNTSSPLSRRASAVPSPTSSLGLQIIREEHQLNPFVSSRSQNKSSSSSSSSEGLCNNVDDEDEMDCDVQNHPIPPQLSPQQQPRQFIRPSTHSLYRVPYHHQTPPPYYCNTSPLLAQYLVIPTTTPTSSTP